MRPPNGVGLFARSKTLARHLEDVCLRQVTGPNNLQQAVKSVAKGQGATSRKNLGFSYK